jgi:hypothetical protein
VDGCGQQLAAGIRFYSQLRPTIASRESRRSPSSWTILGVIKLIGKLFGPGVRRAIAQGGHKKPSTKHRTKLTGTETEYTETKLTWCLNMKTRIYINNFGFDNMLTEMTLKTEIPLTDSIIISYRDPLSIV